ncbi:transcriptional regulator [Photobacterium proteolyticum]|uniref:Transcriptional regulator n=1 Tax=Photobacterium proteolyticum TaxID=1903952 RepID=A0A1Q9GF83_9GAMM|nr:GntR family transcriptional regulator [Photobacterium proteolyticum]OLQ73101.1 transcriptional regulator [Photobacterium proteolyticum]
MDTTAITRLQQDLLFKVIARLKAENAKAGSSLNESFLAKQFEVSRTPLRAVLNHLSAQGITKAVPYKGFVLQVDAVNIEAEGRTGSEQTRQEQLYLRLLMDLFFGELGTSLSEKELQQRYDANRGEMQSVLRLLENDAIFRRSPGYKWQLDGVLNTLDRHTESYRCRLIFEPAGLLEPTWVLDRAALENCRDRHIQAIAEPQAVTASQLFSLSAEFHELLAACSGNRFLLGTMQQHNRLRKATDLVSMHIQSSVSKSCQRRLDIIELVLKGNNQAAATKLAQLLENDIRVMKRTYNDVMNVSRSQRESLVNSIVAKSR